MTIATLVTGGFGNGTITGTVGLITKEGYDVAEVYFTQNQTATVWDGGSTDWDLQGNTYMTLFDTQDNTYSDATSTTSTYSNA